MHHLPDHRYDACLFLLPPHGRPGDWTTAAMRLALLLPVVPLVAKVGRVGGWVGGDGDEGAVGYSPLCSTSEVLRWLFGCGALRSLCC